MWYSFNYGNVHFVNFDTETDYPNAPSDSPSDDDTSPFPSGGFAPSGGQLAWLEADLQQVWQHMSMLPLVSPPAVPCAEIGNACPAASRVLTGLACAVCCGGEGCCPVSRSLVWLVCSWCIDCVDVPL